MPFHDRNLPFKCAKYEKMVVKQQMARHKKFVGTGTLNCPNCPHFFTLKKKDFNYHLANHHAPQDKELNTLCTMCLEEIPSFYSV